MSKVIITGATGMIGGIILQECLQSNEISEVISIARRPSKVSHTKLKEVVLLDFNDYSGHEKLFEDVDIVYYCLGVYTGAVPDDKFKEITYDYTVAFIDVLKQYSPDAYFCFLSGQGADRTEKSKMSFAKYKGMAENYLLEEIDNAWSFRPSYIYPVEKRNEPNLGYKIFRALYPLVKLFGKKFSIKSTELAHAMFKVGLKGNSKSILENDEIQERL
ncbi:NAD-dependent epimerase/dehydratase family protein [Puteibacter caeruleilacunae]|nr:NAD-dependent epimerase/dehydratase family protein [Puteibacter caeruleilacunae]